MFWIPRGENFADMLTHSLEPVNLERQLTMLYGPDNVVGLVKRVRIKSGGDLKYKIHLTWCDLGSFMPTG